MVGSLVPLKKNIELQVEYLHKHGDKQPQIVHYTELSEVVEDAHKDEVKEQVKHRRMLEKVMRRSSTILFNAKTVWPFDMFPSDLIIDINSVTIIKREFFWSGHAESLYIQDLMRITVETGPFFSTLRLIDKSFDTTKHFVRHLRRDDAFRAREILQALLAAVKSGVNLAKCDINRVVPSLSKVGERQLMPAF